MQKEEKKPARLQPQASPTAALGGGTGGELLNSKLMVSWVLGAGRMQLGRQAVRAMLGICTVPAPKISETSVPNLPKVRRLTNAYDIHTWKCKVNPRLRFLIFHNG